MRLISQLRLCVLLLAAIACSATKRTLTQQLRAFLDEVQELEPIDLLNSGKYSSAEAARRWFAGLDLELARQLNQLASASWDYETDISKEHAEQLEHVTTRMNRWAAEQLTEAKKYLHGIDHLKYPDIQRQIQFFVNRNAFTTENEALSKRMAQTQVELERIYSNARVQRDGKTYAIEPELTQLFQQSRDYDELMWAWIAWRNVTGPHMRNLFTTMVDDLNAAAKENGFKDAGEAWRINSFEEDNVEKITSELFDDIRPLYEQLHAYVRRKLMEKYPGKGIDPKGPIPAHLFGDMWAQQWGAISDMVTPYPNVSPYDVNAALRAYSARRMFETSEEFFTSLGFEPMTDVFWERSMIEKPTNRTVLCHGSAEDFMKKDDFRIKMCTTPDQASLQTIHHEMGHIEYFMQYRHQPTVYRTGANAAFHEAVGDTMALSVMTPTHLRAIGLLGAELTALDATKRLKQNKPPADSEEIYEIEQKREINFLLQMALDKVAFLPFGYLIDRWRWSVFRGQITEAEYNSKWWQLRLKYQGIIPPIDRSEDDFDPGSKFHVATFVPYIRYFLSFVGQFQFQQALCDEAGHQESPHKCDIYRSKDAGVLLRSMLNLGASKPWPEAMKVLTGQSNFRAHALWDYFRPLYDWLKERNKHEHIGWT